jgi:mRNA-degrading endonuclease YafQ of YafQ-DinJ toxin-antitoxin module
MRKRPDIHSDIAGVLRLLLVNPFAPQLETHKLKGKLSGSWACSAGCDLRIVFDFVKAGKDKDKDVLHGMIHFKHGQPCKKEIV